MDGDSDTDGDSGDTGDHSPDLKGGPSEQRSMDAPFFVTALIITIALVAIVFFLKG